jgi:S1-C subfamily serine protease
MNPRIKSIATITILLAAAVLSVKAAPATVTPGIDEKKIEDIIKIVAPSVVKVEARNGMRKIATGVVIDKDGFIVTTALISPREEEINVITADGKRIKAEFKGLDTQTQIALIQAKDKGLVPIAMGKSSDLSPGAWIGVVGLSPENTPSITQGIVSSIAQDSLRLNVWVVPGASGSPVVNKEGQMIGLLRGAYTEDQPLVFEFRDQLTVASGYALSRGEAPASGLAKATPIDIVSSISSELKKSGKVARGWIGVSVREQDGKVEIVDINSKSPAELAKLKGGDIILKIDGKDITSGQALSSEIRSRKPGQDVTVRIERDGKPVDVKVKLGEFTEDEAKRELELLFPQFFAPRPLTPFEPRSAKPEKTPQAPKLAPRTLPEPKRDRFFTLEKRKYIGVTLDPLNKDLAAFFGIKEGVGLLVREFAEDSPAQKAGLKIGDVIVKTDGKRLETVAELSEMIQDKKKGDKIKIEFVRDKKAMILEVEIGEDERGFEGFFGDFENNARLLQEQTRKSNEIYQKQIQEFNQKSDESVKRLFEDIEKKARLQSDKDQSLSKQLQKIYKTSGIIYKI